ncbi:MAG: SufE family protein [Bacteroidales bacterium]|nr:SufE family protein [Bacteroidales bacterium]
MSIQETESRFISEFDHFDDWIEKYNYLIEIGKDLPVMESKYKTDNNLISGCQSQVWLHASFEEGKINYKADSNTIITKGIISLLVQILSGHTPDEIINADLKIIKKIGLNDHLSPTRSNGLMSIIKQMKLYAYAFKMKKE